MSILSVKNLGKSFGGIRANHDISFDINPGEILGIIGPNGAGKSTLFDLITGYTRADTGKVIFDGNDITRLRPDRISNLGIGRTFQKLKPFADLTLLENVMIGSFAREDLPGRNPRNSGACGGAPREKRAHGKGDRNRHRC